MAGTLYVVATPIGNLQDMTPRAAATFGSVDFIAAEEKKGSFHHIHGAGARGYAAVLEQLQEKGIDSKQLTMVEIREYIYDMAVVMRAADLVICRSGASTISELTALGTAAILVPSPNVTNNHQEKNARVLEEGGGAVVVLEKDCTAEKMYELIQSLLAD